LHRTRTQPSIDEVPIERPAKINKDLADDRQASEDKEERPDGKVLPDEDLEE
jgi:hypothetical protein